MRPAAEASTSGRAASAGANVWLVSMPWLFVLIWSTGFIVAKYLTPPTTAVMAWLLFDERFPPMAAAGMALAAAGVALVMRGAAAPSRRA